jgi:hypothetical protein
MKKIRNIFITVLVIIIICNLPPAKELFYFSGQKDCEYSNFNGTFTFDEVNFAIRDFDMCMRKFDDFKQVDKSDTILYRLSEINYLQFWNYGDYLFRKKYRLPYMSWEVIKQRRGRVENKTGFQDF